MDNAQKYAPVTCLITAYNAELYIEEAIASLVQQTRPPAEIILVDDGSTDATAMLAKQAGGAILRVIHQKNAGSAAGRNRGLKEISQPFVMFADADDISHPDRIERCLDAFAEMPELAAVFGNWQNFWIDALVNEEDAESSKHLKGEQKSRLLCTGLLRSEFSSSLGEFDTTLALSEVHWVVRALKTGSEIHDLGVATYRRRIHHSNISRGKTPDDMFAMVQRLRHASGSA